MIYKKYGEIFRNLRENRGFTLSEFTQLDISKPALSKFERGETMMSFEKVVSALSLMGVSLEEYEYFINSYSKNESDYLIDEIENASLSQDTSKLKSLESIASQENFPYISLAAKASYRTLDKEDIESLTSRLTALELWSYKELCIFFLTMEQLETLSILQILDVFLKKEHNLFKSSKYRSYLVQTCCRAITTFSARGYKEYAEYVLNRIDSYNLINSMYLKNLVNISLGYWRYCFESRDVGNEMMIEALKIFKEVSTPEIYKYYLERYNYFVVQNKSRHE